MSFDLHFHQFVSPDFNAAFKQVYTNRKLSIQDAYDVRKMAEEIDRGVKSFHKRREEIYKEVEKLPETEAEERFKKEMTDFGAKTFTVNSKKISLRKIDKTGIQLSAYDLDLLEPILVDDLLRVTN